MKIAIVGAPFSSQFSKYVKHLLLKLQENKIDLVIEEKFSNFLIDQSICENQHAIFESLTLEDNVDFLFSIGGDGTLLRAITYIKDKNIPIMGINTGRLGFIASISTDQIDQTLNNILKGEYTIRKRTALQLITENNLFGDDNFALNEVAIVKKDTSSMIRINSFLNDEFLNSYWADGLLISTPTGSTGYSLSCGGPIILPETENMIITPIAPHNLNVRPIIINENNIVKLKIEDRDKLALVSLDSRSRAFESSLELTIKAASFKMRIVEPKGHSFINTIRTKLMWGSDKRN
ncbi:MAG: NAD kinase [Flavobacteriales bacterium]|nr:NAD kinase [Flavobacteriales bacterium]|tara:strand:- start:3945 stop:4820 length:876 start_codon:yes stop_codon:yes gene_type:complete